MVVSFGHDENGRYIGGKAGDQTGDEGKIRSWYNYPPSKSNKADKGGWDCVLRFPNRKVGKRIAKKARNAAKNNMIGYDQGNRLSLYYALSRCKWRCVDILEPVECDCSSSTTAFVIATGKVMGLKKLQQLNPSLTTGYIRNSFKAVGFIVLTDKKYLTSEDYLLEGDIPLNEKHHVIVNVTDGKYAKEEIAKMTKQYKGYKDKPTNV